MCGIFLYIQKLISNNDFKIKQNKEIYDKFTAIGHRGPEASIFNTFVRKEVNEEINMGFHRLKIIGTKGELGMQPFYSHATNTYLLMNGEIYNHLNILNMLKAKKLISSNFKLKSDCEIIILLYKFYTVDEIVKMIKGEYAFVLLDLTKNKIFMARDELGIRPIFYNVTSSDISISSEYKGIVNSTTAEQVEPSTIYTIDLDNYNNKIQKKLYYDIESIKSYAKLEYTALIKQKFIEAVQIRLNAERPLGFLLSGGFDSSLVLAVAAELIINNNLTQLLPINAFSIQYTGNNTDSNITENEDIYHAKVVVDYLNKKYFNNNNNHNIIKHHIVYFNKTEGLQTIPEVIYFLESKCITTIRASTPMYILVKYIKKNTDIKVLFSGECADELFFSYLYYKYAPNELEFDAECRKLLKRIYLYDVLRADRVISSHGLEARVPFSDREFITEYLSTELKYRYEPKKIEKYLIREAFKNNYLPEETRMRTKEAFSNSVNTQNANWIDDIIKFCKNQNVTEEQYYINIMKNFNYPITLVANNWLPNQEWVDTNGEPSATVLSCYNNNNIQMSNNNMQ